VVASDPDAGTVLSYAITGGSDAGRFQINSSTGALSFVSAPNFEAPNDSDANNSYVVVVQASDGSLVDSQTITVNVSNVNEAPTGATLAGNAVAENSANGTVVGTVTGQDPDAGASLSYSLANNAGGRFAINASTGQITVANGSLLDYESATSHAITVGDRPAACSPTWLHAT
jgi:VCBS repeat-containing protein